jgi:hypothetical protein
LLETIRCISNGIQYAVQIFRQGDAELLALGLRVIKSQGMCMKEQALQTPAVPIRNTPPAAVFFIPCQWNPEERSVNPYLVCPPGKRNCLDKAMSSIVLQ